MKRSSITDIVFNHQSLPINKISAAGCFVCMASSKNCKPSTISSFQLSDRLFVPIIITICLALMLFSPPGCTRHKTFSIAPTQNQDLRHFWFKVFFSWTLSAFYRSCRLTNPVLIYRIAYKNKLMRLCFILFTAIPAANWTYITTFQDFHWFCNT